MPEKVGGRGIHHLRLVPALLILAAVAVPAHGAQFQLGTLVQVGFPATGGAIGAGDSSTAPSVSTNTANFQNNQARRVEIEYQKGTNTVELRLYQDGTNTSAFSKVDFNPAGGGLVAADATWTIPAASFFVTATSGPNTPTSITLSNIALTGISGALNILQPIQQTTLSASRAANGATTTITQTQDIVFQGDANGSWLLTGTLNLTGIAGPVGATGSNLAFGFTTSAVGSAVPEPPTLGLIGSGLVLLGLINRRKFLRS